AKVFLSTERPHRCLHTSARGARTDVVCALDRATDPLPSPPPPPSSSRRRLLRPRTVLRGRLITSRARAISCDGRQHVSIRRGEFVSAPIRGRAVLSLIHSCDLVSEKHRA